MPSGMTMSEERMGSWHFIPINVLLNKKKIFTFLFKIGLQKITAYSFNEYVSELIVGKLYWPL